MKHAKDVLQSTEQDTLPETAQPASAYQPETYHPAIAHQETHKETEAAHQRDDLSSPMYEIRSLQTKPSITFENSCGDLYQLPYHKVQNWNVFNLFFCL